MKLIGSIASTDANDVKLFKQQLFDYQRALLINERLYTSVSDMECIDDPLSISGNTCAAVKNVVLTAMNVALGALENVSTLHVGLMTNPWSSVAHLCWSSFRFTSQRRYFSTMPLLENLNKNRPIRTAL